MNAGEILNGLVREFIAQTERQAAALERLESVLERLAEATEHPLGEHLKREPSRAFMTEEELAERTGMSPAALKQLRRTGAGPRFLRIGRSPRYRTADVLRWEERQLVSSTSKPCM